MQPLPDCISASSGTILPSSCFIPLYSADHSNSRAMVSFLGVCRRFLNTRVFVNKRIQRGNTAVTEQLRTVAEQSAQAVYGDSSRSCAQSDALHHLTANGLCVSSAIPDTLDSYIHKIPKAAGASEFSIMVSLL